jgi:PAS domain S-box-containing protein
MADNYLEKEFRELMKNDVSIHEFVLNSSVDGIWFRDLEQEGCEWMSAGFWKKLGYERDEIPPLSIAWQRVIDPEDLAPVNDSIARHLQEPSHSCELIVRFVHKDGSKVWVRRRGSVIRNKDGQAVRMLGTLNDITASVNTELSLTKAKEEAEENAQQLKNIADNLFDGMIYQVFAPDEKQRKITYVSETVTRFYGCSVEEALADANLIYSKVHEDDIQKLVEGEKQAIKTMSVFNVIVRMINPDGSLRWSHFTSRPRLHNGLIYWDGIEIDISPLKKQEEELTQLNQELHRAREQAEASNNKHYERILNLMEGFYVVALDGRLLEYNSEFARVLKLEAGKDHSGLRLRDFIYDQMQADQTLEELKKNGFIKNAEIKLKRSDGEPVYVLLSSRLVRDTKDNMLRIEGSLLDINERRKAEKALLKSAERFRTVVSNAPLITFAINKDGIFTLSEGKVLEKLGLMPGQVVGLSVFDLYKDYPVIIDSVKKALAGQSSRCEIAVMGTVFDSLYSPVFDENGKVIQVIGVSNDITERKQAEQAFIENQRLSTIGEMASAVAHDFNNALQSILGNIEFSMLQPGLPPNAFKYLSIAKKALIDTAVRVKLLQRFGEKKLTDRHHSPVNINTLIDDVMLNTRHLWKVEAQKKGLSIAIETKYADSPMVSGIEGELSAVIFNLVKNSVEAMPDGGRIRIETKIVSVNVSITVSDTGTGMTEETKARIFQPFFTTKGFDVGRGLGMSGAYSIIKEHGGSISVKKTELGIGTTIEILLPLTEMKEDESKERN